MYVYMQMYIYMQIYRDVKFIMMCELIPRVCESQSPQPGVRFHTCDR